MADELDDHGDCLVCVSALLCSPLRRRRDEEHVASPTPTCCACCCCCIAPSVLASASPQAAAFAGVVAATGVRLGFGVRGGGEEVCVWGGGDQKTRKARSGLPAAGDDDHTKTRQQNRLLARPTATARLESGRRTVLSIPSPHTHADAPPPLPPSSAPSSPSSPPSPSSP